MPDNSYSVFLTSFDHRDDTQSTRVSVSLTAWTPPPEDINHPHIHPEVDFWLTGYNCNSDNINLAIIIETRIKSLNTRKYHSVACSFYNVTRSPPYFLRRFNWFLEFMETIECRLLFLVKNQSLWPFAAPCFGISVSTKHGVYGGSTPYGVQVCSDKPRRYSSDWGRQWQTLEYWSFIIWFWDSLWGNDIQGAVILCLFWLVLAMFLFYFIFSYSWIRFETFKQS